MGIGELIHASGCAGPGSVVRVFHRTPPAGKQATVHHPCPSFHQASMSTSPCQGWDIPQEIQESSQPVVAVGYTSVRSFHLLS